MAKGQKRSNREKKKPKANKKKVSPTTSPFASTAPRGKPSQSDVPKKPRDQPAFDYRGASLVSALGHSPT